MLVRRVYVTVFWVLIGSYLKILLSIFMVWKHEVVTALTWAVMPSLLSIMIPRFLVQVVSVGPSSVGHQVESYGEVPFLKITILILSVFSFRPLCFIQSPVSVMQALNLIWVLGVMSVRKRMSYVSLA